MKRLIIAEEEKRRILGLYTRFLINEQSNEDIEFNTWLISEFPSVASKYGISTPSTKIDSNTLYKIKNESAIKNF